MAKGTKKNWKTTALGVMTGLGLLLTQLTAVLDDDASTEWRGGMVLAALSAMGIGWFSRDKDVSSEGTKAGE